MSNEVEIKVARTENGYTAACDLLEGWVVAVNGDFCSLEKEVKESIKLFVEWAKEDGDEYNHIFDVDYKLVYHFDVRSLLSYYQKIFSLSALEFITGINQRQLSHYLNGTSKPRPLQSKKIEKGLKDLSKELQAISL